MSDIELRAEQDYKDLFLKIKLFDGSFRELYDYLGGHNYEENDYFDLNYGAICVTVKLKNNKFVLDTDGIEIWDDETLTLIETYYHITDETLKELNIKGDL